MNKQLSLFIDAVITKLLSPFSVVPLFRYEQQVQRAHQAELNANNKQAYAEELLKKADSLKRQLEYSAQVESSLRRQLIEANKRWGERPVWVQYDNLRKMTQVGLRFYVDEATAREAGPAVSRYYAEEVERALRKALAEGQF